MARFENIFGNFVMVGLVILGLFSVIVIVQGDNNATQPLIEDALFNETYAGLNNTISGLEATSTSKFLLFNTETPVLGFGSIVLFTIVNVGKTFGSLIFTMFTLMIKVPLVVLGIEASITAMIISFLTITTIIALWVVYKFGG